MPLASAAETGSSSCPVASISTSRSGLLQHRVRLALDDVDHQRVGQLARDARVRDPRQLQQLVAQRVRDRPAASPGRSRPSTRS